MPKNDIEILKTNTGLAVYVGSNVTKAIEVINSRNIKHVIVSHDHGYSQDNVMFLNKIPSVEILTIQHYGPIDISGIHVLYNLKILGLNIIGGNNQVIDFSCFPKIEDCSFTWMSKAKSLFECTSLKKLYLNKFNRNDFEDFKNMYNLEEIAIGSSPIKSLNGLENTNVHSLYLCFLTKLETLTGIESLADKIVELNINTCKKIKNINEVASLVNLERLGFNNCGDIESIKPISNLKRLSRFEFWESTNILDGDMTPCLNLKEVAFQNRKHYTHTNDAIDRIIKNSVL